jgi:hypothetical protein
MRFVLISLCIAFLFIDVLLIIGLINNYKGIVSLPWWKMFLGPLAWLVTDFPGKSGGGVLWVIMTALCIGAVILEIQHDCIQWRIASSVAVALWVLAGLSAISIRYHPIKNQGDD